MGSLLDKLEYLAESVGIINGAAAKVGLEKTTFRQTANALALKIQTGDKAYKFRKITNSYSKDAIGSISGSTQNPVYVAQLYPINGYICGCNAKYLEQLCKHETNATYGCNFNSGYQNTIIIGDDGLSYAIATWTIRAQAGTIHFKGKYRLDSYIFLPPVVNPGVFAPRRGIIWGECESCSSRWLSVSTTASVIDARFEETTTEVHIVCTAPITCDTYFQAFSISQSDLVGIINKLEQTTTTKTLQIGTDNLAKLTQEQIDVATNKGWTIK